MQLAEILQLLLLLLRCLLLLLLWRCSCPCGHCSVLPFNVDAHL